MESKSTEDFYARLDNVLALSERQLIHRWNVVKKLRVCDVPFIFGEGIYQGSDKLKSEEPIEEALKNGTLTIGFIGCAEMCKALYGKHHFEDETAMHFAYDVVAHMRKFTDRLIDKYKLNFSLISTPAEGLSGRFIKIDKKKFGIVEGITDKGHYTNSFHCPVDYNISIQDKVSGEAPFHKLCNGGHISYVEIPAPPLGNVDGLYSLMKFMCEKDMGYFGFNFPSNFCKECGFFGIIPSEGCQKCGNKDIRRVLRVTGYFSTEGNIGPGKSDEISRRVNHAGRVVEFKSE